MRFVCVATLGVALLCSCGGNPAQPTRVPFGEAFELRPGERVALEGGVTFQFIDVPSDSRCPLDVMCVTAGEAFVDGALLTMPETPPQTLTLIGGITINGIPVIDGVLATVPWCVGSVTRMECRLSTSEGKSTANARTHSVRLLELRPHPRAGTQIPRSDYVGKFIVTPR